MSSAALPVCYFSCLPDPMLPLMPTRGGGPIIKVFWALVSCARGGYECCPTVGDLMALTGIKERTVQRALRWLIDHGMIDEETAAGVRSGRWFRHRWRRAGSGGWEPNPPEPTLVFGVTGQAPGGVTGQAPGGAHGVSPPPIETAPEEWAPETFPVSPPDLAEEPSHPATGENGNGNDGLDRCQDPEETGPPVPGWTADEEPVDNPPPAPAEVVQQRMPEASGQREAAEHFRPSAEEIAQWEREKDLAGARGCHARRQLAMVRIRAREEAERLNPTPASPAPSPAPPEPLSESERRPQQPPSAPLPPRVTREPSVPLNQVLEKIRALPGSGGSSEAVAMALSRRWRDPGEETRRFLAGFFSEVQRGTLAVDHALGLVQDADRKEIRAPAHHFARHGGAALRRAKRPPAAHPARSTAGGPSVLTTSRETLR